MLCRIVLISATPSIAGHSFGAATALIASSKAAGDFSTCVVMDAWMFPIERDFYTTARDANVPVLFINAGRFQWEDNLQRKEKMFQQRIGHDVHIFTIPYVLLLQ